MNKVRAALVGLDNASREVLQTYRGDSPILRRLREAQRVSMLLDKSDPQASRFESAEDLLRFYKPGAKTDGAPIATVAEDALHCVLAWDPRARLIGNVRASDLARVFRFVIQTTAVGESAAYAIGRPAPMRNEGRSEEIAAGSTRLGDETRRPPGGQVTGRRGFDSGGRSMKRLDDWEFEETPTVMSGLVVRWTPKRRPWANYPEVSASREGVAVQGHWPVMGGLMRETFIALLRRAGDVSVQICTGAYERKGES